MWRIAFSLALSLCWGVAHAQDPELKPLDADLYSTPPAGAEQNYVLNVGDVVEVTVREDESLNRRAMIRPDGKISLPLAGTLRAAGGTVEMLQEEILFRLKDSFVTTPTVTVALVGLASSQGGAQGQAAQASIYVLGEVARPGRYEVDVSVDILQALSLAGGPSAFAAKDRIQIRRGENVELFDYSAVEDGEVFPIVKLSDGDVIVVPERGLFE